MFDSGEIMDSVRHLNCPIFHKAKLRFGRQIMKGNLKKKSRHMQGNFLGMY